MNDNEYREFLKYIFERYVRPRLAFLRERYSHHFEDQFSHELSRVERSVRLCRYIEGDTDENIYSTFQPHRLLQAVGETRNGLSFNTDMLESGGFMDEYEAHADEILAGLQAEHLPEVDKDLLREMGSMSPDSEIQGLVYTAKARCEHERHHQREVPVRQELRNIEKRLAEAANDFKVVEEMFKRSFTGEVVGPLPKKSRRWFKGLGQIGQGCALSIANAALAVGALHLPVSPETRTWGAIASVATGIGAIMNGIGDLRAE